MDPSGQSQAQESQVQVLQEQELQDHEHQVQAAQGQEPSQDQPNQDASEGEETQGQDMQPQEVIPQSIPFQTFPLEIQMAIFKEAIQKPSVHFLFVERRVRGQIWEVKITPVPKGSDTSGYRYLQELSTVCASAHAAVKWATIESRSIKFSLLPNKVDAATDLFVMRFQRHRNVSPRYAYLQDCFWNSMHEIIPPRLNRTAAREKFRNMRKVGVTWRYHHTGSCAREGTVPFKCLRVGHDTHKQFKICPVELAGFFDCFPELETFYIIVYFPFRRYGDLTEDLIQLRDKIIGPPTNRRRNPAVEVLYDSKSTYLELLKKDCNQLTRLWNVDVVFEILELALAQYSTRSNVWITPREQRRRVRLKVLLELPEE